jgi:conjugal transfer/entry exclusion protein
MSLQLLAKQMEAKGRKGDSMLVHMTADEVAGLQKLAESAGGSLTINPETGLVEANFLKRMLPTLVGIGVGIGTGNPFLGAAAGAAVGGYQAKQNKQDVLVGAGLGALGGYGGAGLGAGLTAAGGTAAAGAAGQQAATLSAEELAKKQAAEELAKQAAADEATRQATEQAGKNLAEEQAKQQLLSSTGVTPPSMTMSGTQPDLAAQYGMTDVNMTPMPANVQPMPVQPELTAAERFSQAGRGIGQLGTEAGRTEFGKEFGIQQAMAGAAPAMAPGKLEEPEEFVEDDEMYYTEYTPGQTGERSSTSTEARQFAESRFAPMESIKASEYRDRVRRRSSYAAEGGLMRLAEGGAVAGNSGASADAMSYLMGQAPGTTGMPSASQAGLQYLMGQSNQSPVMQSALAKQSQTSNFVVPERARSTTSTLDGFRQIAGGQYAGLYEAEDGKMAFDPASQKFYQTGNVFEYVPPPPPEPAYDIYQGGAAAGGLVGLAKGGMKSGGFVIPADVVSMVGEGNTDAGYSRIKSMVPGATAIKGKDGGQADTVKTSIEGKQPARVAHGEMYVPPETVKRMGGAKKLYAMMDRVRDQATGSKQQIKPVSLKKALA